MVQNINTRIKELTENIEASNKKQVELYGSIQLLPEVWLWNKELRRLRRQRNGNIDNDN